MPLVKIKSVHRASALPQHRRRSVLLAIQKEKGCEQTLDLPVPDRDPNAQILSAREAIGYLPPLEAGERSKDIPNHVCQNLTEINRHRLMSVKPGEPNLGFSKTPYGDLSLPCHRRHADKGEVDSAMSILESTLTALLQH